MTFETAFPPSKRSTQPEKRNATISELTAHTIHPSNDLLGITQFAYIFSSLFIRLSVNLSCWLAQSHYRPFHYTPLFSNATNHCLALEVAYIDISRMNPNSHQRIPRYPLTTSSTARPSAGASPPTAIGDSRPLQPFRELSDWNERILRAIELNRIEREFVREKKKANPTTTNYTSDAKRSKESPPQVDGDDNDTFVIQPKDRKPLSSSSQYPISAAFLLAQSTPAIQDRRAGLVELLESDREYTDQSVDHGHVSELKYSNSSLYHRIRANAMMEQVKPKNARTRQHQHQHRQPSTQVSDHSNTAAETLDTNSHAAAPSSASATIDPPTRPSTAPSLHQKIDQLRLRLQSDSQPHQAKSSFTPNAGEVDDGDDSDAPIDSTVGPSPTLSVSHPLTNHSHSLHTQPPPIHLLDLASININDWIKLLGFNTLHSFHQFFLYSVQMIRERHLSNLSSDQLHESRAKSIDWDAFIDHVKHQEVRYLSQCFLHALAFTLQSYHSEAESKEDELNGKLALDLNVNRMRAKTMLTIKMRADVRNKRLLAQLLIQLYQLYQLPTTLPSISSLLSLLNSAPVEMFDSTSAQFRSDRRPVSARVQSHRLEARRNSNKPNRKENHNRPKSALINNVNKKASTTHPHPTRPNHTTPQSTSPSRHLSARVESKQLLEQLNDQSNSFTRELTQSLNSHPMNHLALFPPPSSSSALFHSRPFLSGHVKRISQQLTDRSNELRSFNRSLASDRDVAKSLLESDRLQRQLIFQQLDEEYEFIAHSGGDDDVKDGSAHHDDWIPRRLQSLKSESEQFSRHFPTTIIERVDWGDTKYNQTRESSSNQVTNSSPLTSSAPSVPPLVLASRPTSSRLSVPHLLAVDAEPRDFPYSVLSSTAPDTFPSFKHINFKLQSFDLPNQLSPSIPTQQYEEICIQLEPGQPTIEMTDIRLVRRKDSPIERDMGISTITDDYFDYSTLAPVDTSSDMESSIVSPPTKSEFGVDLPRLGFDFSLLVRLALARHRHELSERDRLRMESTKRRVDELAFEESKRRQRIETEAAALGEEAVRQQLLRSRMKENRDDAHRLDAHFNMYESIMSSISEEIGSTHSKWKLNVLEAEFEQRRKQRLRQRQQEEKVKEDETRETTFVNSRVPIVSLDSEYDHRLDLSPLSIHQPADRSLPSSNPNQQLHSASPSIPSAATIHAPDSSPFIPPISPNQPFHSTSKSSPSIKPIHESSSPMNSSAFEFEFAHQLESRLLNIWRSLHMTNRDILSMLEKYSHPTIDENDANSRDLLQALRLWEKSAKAWAAIESIINQRGHKVGENSLNFHDTGADDQHSNLLSLILECAHACYELVRIHQDWVTLGDEPLILRLLKCIDFTCCQRANQVYIEVENIYKVMQMLRRNNLSVASVENSPSAPNPPTPIDSLDDSIIGPTSIGTTSQIAACNTLFQLHHNGPSGSNMRGTVDAKEFSHSHSESPHAVGNSMPPSARPSTHFDVGSGSNSSSVSASPYHRLIIRKPPPVLHPRPLLPGHFMPVVQGENYLQLPKHNNSLLHHSHHTIDESIVSLNPPSESHSVSHPSRPNSALPNSSKSKSRLVTPSPPSTVAHRKATKQSNSSAAATIAAQLQQRVNNKQFNMFL